MKHLFTIMLLLFGMICWSQNQLDLANSYNPKHKLKPKELLEDLEVFEKSLIELHPGLDLYANKNALLSQLDLLTIVCQKPMTENAFYLHLAKIVASFHSAHTAVFPSEHAVAYEQEKELYFPFKVKIIQDKLFVRINCSYDESIQRGTEFIKINGDSVSNILPEMRQYVSSNGFIPTNRDALLSKIFATYYLRIYGHHKNFVITLKDPETNEIRTTILPGSTAIDFGNWKKKRMLYDSWDKGRHIYFKQIKTIGSCYLRLETFDGDAFKEKEIDFEQYIDQAFDTINQYQNLIIDLRGNEGGWLKNSTLLYSYLTDQDDTYCYTKSFARNPTKGIKYWKYTDKDSAYFNTSGKELTLTPYGWVRHDSFGTEGDLPSHPKAFKGKIYLLVDGLTWSATGSLAIALSYRKDVIVIGEESGSAQNGNCGVNHVLLTLPNSKIRMSIPLYYRENCMYKNEDEYGRGVIPDHIIYENGATLLQPDDYIFTYTRQLISKGN